MRKQGIVDRQMRHTDMESLDEEEHDENTQGILASRNTSLKGNPFVATSRAGKKIYQSRGQVVQEESQDELFSFTHVW